MSHIVDGARLGLQMIIFRNTLRVRSLAWDQTIWSLTSVESHTFPFCVYVCFVYVLVHVSVLTITDFIKVLSIDNLCIE